MAWRYRAERFVASVAAENERRSFLWYVSGSQTDLTTAVLYRVDIRTGERKQMASWRRPVRIDQASIAYASGRVSVAAVSPDSDQRTLQAGIDCFDAGSAGRLWEKSYNTRAKTADLRNPIGLFTAQGDSLTYSIGPERWAVRATDGVALPGVNPPLAADHTWELHGDNLGVEIDTRSGKVVAQHATLWPPSSFRIQSGRLYAYTADGHAYAMGAP